jgi:hypothetical protein
MDPTLALAYYHCCSINPHTAIFNDELGLDIDTSAMWDRTSNLIGDPIGKEETVLHQQTFNNLNLLHAKIAACVSCCKRLLSLDGQEELVEMKIDALPLAFLLTELQIQQLTSLPRKIVENHVQVIKHNGPFYHLNPELVFDANKMGLCPVSAKNPMTKDQESMTAGKNYG